ncbi:MAG: hypothetical protein KBT31_05525 [Firmicutes bacterium]|nr:hypothetical protein [Candidatus Colimorpha enterica]
MVSGKDRLGFAVVRGQSALFAGVCAGMKFTERDSDGNYSIVVDREENFDIFSKLYTLYNDTEGVFTYNEGTTDYHAKKVFADGRSLFCNEYVLSTWDETLRNMTNEFAVIPRPKNNEDQKEYITVLQDSFLLYTIPSCISLDKVPVVTAMIEAQGIINNRDVIPAIFDTALKSKFRSDLVDYEQASRLIELVRSGITTDFGVVYDNSLNNIANLVGRLIMNRSNNYASEIAGNITLFQTSLEDLMMAFEQLR